MKKLMIPIGIMCGLIATQMSGNPVIASSELDESSSSAQPGSQSRVQAVMQRLSPQDKEAILKILRRYEDIKAPRVEEEIVSCCVTPIVNSVACPLPSDLQAILADIQADISDIDAQLVTINANIALILSILVGP